MSTDFPHVLHIQFRGVRQLPLKHYIDQILGSYSPPSTLMEKLYIVMAMDTPLSRNELKRRSKVPVYRNFSIVIGSGPIKCSSVNSMESHKLMHANVVTLYKPVKSGLYEWTQWDFTHDTQRCGVASGIVENDQIALKQYWD